MTAPSAGAPTPQYSVQKMSKVPSRVASNHSELYMPGTTSRFTRSAGTKKEWMTAPSPGFGPLGMDAMMRRTGRLIGTVSSLSDDSAPGWKKRQPHRYASTRTLMELGGGTDMNMKP